MRKFFRCKNKKPDHWAGYNLGDLFITLQTERELQLTKLRHFLNTPATFNNFKVEPQVLLITYTILGHTSTIYFGVFSFPKLVNGE